MAVILVTHDLGVVAQSCDRVAVLYAGRVAEYGEVGAVFGHPRHAYTLGLLRSVPDARHARQPLRPISGAPPPADTVGARCAFMPRCAYSTAACAAERPPLMTMPDGRLSACLHWDRLEATEWAA